MDEDHGKLNFFETSSELSELFGADFETLRLRKLQPPLSAQN